MVTRADDLNELAANVSAAMAQATRLQLPTSAYILSMVMVEVTEALRAEQGGFDDEDG
jgi:hypothetical protein